MAELTVASEPPSGEGRQRRSRWAELFEECRQHQGEWRRIVEPLKKTTAAQIASDIRNVRTRDLEKTRLRGFLPDDVWEAVWANSPDDDDEENFYIWLRFMGSVPRDAPTAPPATALTKKTAGSSRSELV